MQLEKMTKSNMKLNRVYSVNDFQALPGTEGGDLFQEMKTQSVNYSWCSNRCMHKGWRLSEL